MSKLVNYFSNETRLTLNIDSRGKYATIVARTLNEYSESQPEELIRITQDNEKWKVEFLSPNVSKAEKVQE